MLNLPSRGYKVYEVSDQWADIQVRDVVARDESEARTLIAERFPIEDGFVVEDVCQCRF
jgi:hypothetical protein